jgi:hypothetical protein
MIFWTARPGGVRSQSSLDHRVISSRPAGGKHNHQSRFPSLKSAHSPVVWAAAPVCDCGDPDAIRQIQVKDRKGKPLGKTLSESTVFVWRPSLGSLSNPGDGIHDLCVEIEPSPRARLS